MFAAPSIFLDFNLPNATTWFYFSLLLAVALFFKFSRLMSMRNLDVLTLFLLVPGLLLVQADRLAPTPATQKPEVLVPNLLAEAAASSLGLPGGMAHPAAGLGALAQANLPWPYWKKLGYLWLLAGSAYFFIRCLIDLILVQRPALSPNLSYGGSAWFAAALFVCLGAVAFRQAEERTGSSPNGQSSQGVPSTKAQVGPVSTGISLIPPWLRRTFALVCHLAVLAGLITMGGWHFQDVAIGMAAATFYLVLPYTGLFVDQEHHVWPAALLVWALVLYRWPVASGFLLGIAIATAYFPVVLLPCWLSFYWRRGGGRFLAISALTVLACLGTLALVLWSQGILESSIREFHEQSAWQPWKSPTTESVWTGIHWAYRIPIFFAWIGFVLLTAAWPFPKNLAHLIALNTAILIGIQFWYANQGGLYVLWYLPLLLLLVFRPNLHDRRPAAIDPQADWAARLGAWLRSMFRRRAPETVQSKS